MSNRVSLGEEFNGTMGFMIEIKNSMVKQRLLTEEVVLQIFNGQDNWPKGTPEKLLTSFFF